MYCRTGLNPRAMSQFGDSQISIQISDNFSRAFIVGTYLESGDLSEWTSVKEEIRQIHSIFLNPIIVIGGDFNNFLVRIKKLAGKLELNSSNFDFTREQVTVGIAN
jgi:hypothetical protein